MYLFRKENLARNIELYILHIEDFDDSLVERIDKNIVKICEGYSRSSIDEVKKRIVKFIENKDLNKKYGAVSEFFLHLYLNHNRYKQDCLFFNLEENQVKKGFDGVYSKNGEIFLMESKSGSCQTKNISHINKIKEAYNDLDKYITGESEKGLGNPWINAYNHANQGDVKAKKSIKDKIWQIRKDFENGIYSKTEDFNIIPCSTIYLDGEWSETWSNNLLTDKSKLIGLNGRKVKILSITNKNIENFFKYLMCE